MGMELKEINQMVHKSQKKGYLLFLLQRNDSII